MPVEFRLLGAVELRVDGVPVDLGHARQLSVLAILLVDANQVVSADQLIDRVWGEHPPHTARNTLHGYLHRLRQTLSDVPGVAIGRGPGGYVLTVDPDSVDLHRFRGLVVDARDAADALPLLDEALRLWQGDALPGVSTPWLDDVRRGLDRERLAAELDRADAGLRAGRHGELVSTLSALAEAHPLDERLACQLMLALYRDGRQADALARFQQTRDRLVDELGVDPGAPLQELHRRILAADPALATTTAVPVPRQLPARPPLFSGRAADLAQLDKALDADSPSNVVAVTGAGGVGKTWLALTWAHRNADRFPHGQLYVDLRGFAPAGEPVSPGSALAALLDALGVEPGAAPSGEDALAARYRSLGAGRRMLIVLDDAHDSAQVLPLLPGTDTCAVLITGRNRLTGLAAAHGATTVELDVLTDSEARDVLAGHVGADRVAAEPGPVAGLLAACAGLPLAISVVGARAAAHPTFPLAVLADELRDAANRLDALATGELTADLRAVLTTSSRALSPAAARLYGLLGAVPGPDIGTAAVAALAEVPTAAALRELERAHLVRQHVPGRYRMHDLTRLHAAESAPPGAMRRLADLYLATAHHADRELNPHHQPLEPAPDPAAQPIESPAGRARAKEWFDRELPVLLAVQEAVAARGWHIPAWQFAWVLDGYLWRTGHLLHHVATWRIGLAAAERLGERTIRARAHRRLGQAFARAEQHAAALAHLDDALASAEDRMEQARAHDVYAWTWARQGDNRKALEHAEHVLRLYRELALPERIANALNTVGWYHAHLGEFDSARAHCEQAVAMHRAHGDHDGESCALDSLGFIARQAGRFGEAADSYRAALAVFRRIGNAYEEANTLDNLGDVLDAMGRPGDAVAAWRQALDLHRVQRRTREMAGVQRKLAR
jgi:DNA-binding SARP family transcriptional activator/Tfp pilus assembly protein PilF